MPRSKEESVFVTFVCTLAFLVGYTYGDFAVPNPCKYEHDELAAPDAFCKDVLPNCAQYAATGACHGKFDQWAKDNCNQTCKYCVGVEPPCEDEDSNCGASDKSACDNPAFQQWAEHTCRFTCRRCSAESLAVKLATITTLPPALCKDKMDCRLYGSTSCGGQYAHWAKENCPQFCGLCTGLPTPPKPCVDTIPNCAAFGKPTCMDTKFTIWVQDKCRKFCGICNAVVAPGFLTPSPIQTGRK